MSSKTFFKQPWLNSALSDSVFILFPPFLALLIVALLPAQFKTTAGMPPMYWFVLIVFIDVAHVYSTLYRTYFNPAEFKANRQLLILVPLGCYIVGVLLHNINPMLFWSILAYLAVFHFIRQQYGFMRLYSRFEQAQKTYRMIDTITIYASTIYPILYWHLSGNRNFSWFIDGDFVAFQSVTLATTAGICYLLILAIYVVKEVIQYLETRHFNIPKNLLLAGTCVSWYFGIIYYNGDMAFTLLNVVSHGIPYIALIWFFEKRKYLANGHKKSGRVLRLTFGRYGILFFLIVIAALAYLEEGLWDGFVWREHPGVFGLFTYLPKINEKELLSLLLPLLALPQSAHYVLDGFIWRRKEKQATEI